MAKSQNMLTNLLFSALSWLSNSALLVVLILAARFLGDEVYGQFAFAFSLVALFETATDFGMKDYVVREMARRPDQRAGLLAEAMALKAGLSVLTIGALVSMALTMDLRPDVRLAVLLLTVAMVAKSFKLLFRQVLVAHERFKRESFLVVADRVLVLVATTVALLVTPALLPFTVSFAVAGVLALGVTFFGTDRALRGFRGRVSWSSIVGLLKRSLPFGLTAGMFLLYLRLDTVMLSRMRNDAEVGWYSAAYRLVEGLIFVPMILQYVLFPRLSVVHLESRSKVEMLLRKACRHLIAAGLPIAAIGILLAGPVVHAVYGAQYAPATPALQILLLSLPLMFLSSTLRVAHNAVNQPRVPLVAATLGVIVNVGSNLVLIPRYGHLGTSWSTVAAEVVLLGYMAIALHTRGYRPRLPSSAVKPTLALLPTVAVMVWASAWNPVLLGVLGVAMYGGLLLLLRFLEADEIEALGELRDRLGLGAGTGRRRGG